MALEGLGQLIDTVDLIKNNLQPDLKVLGALLTMHDKRNRLSEQILQDLKSHFPFHVFSTVIPRNVRLTESPSYGQSILAYDAASKGAKAYEQLAREVMEKQPIISYVNLS